ncbi:MAG: hypothetical protein F8N37_07935 [Telmatospirillum sp.]|nr:hypothetical protein [Telmatospirillum sp.]
MPLPTDPPPPRPGPRPLLMHLLEQALLTAGSQIALPALRNGSFVWRPHLASTAESLQSQLANVDPDLFGAALAEEGRRRLGDFLGGVEAYRDHPYQRRLPAVPVVWQDGTTRLLDYGGPGATGPAVLLVPSLINRGYILDLTPRRSLVRYLAGRGIRPFLLDWDCPGPAERGFALEDYVAGRLSRALDAVLVRAGRPLLAGYCMGGLLALGAGVLRQDDVRGLALLATPWDFHQPDGDQAGILRSLRPFWQDVITLYNGLPVDVLQGLFAAIDPGGIGRKFRQFGRLKRKSVRASDFVAVEDWLNDGVPLAAGVAHDCLTGWYIENRPARGEWRLAGRTLQASDFRRPCLALIPERDRIVPPQSALALPDAMPQARSRMISTGHIGMVTGRRAKSDAYTILAKWILGFSNF